MKVGILSGVRHAAMYLPMLTELGHQVAIAEEPDAPKWMRTDAERLSSSPLLDPEQLWQWEPELVLVCSEPTRHARLATAVARRSIPLLIDKPAATSLADGLALREVLGEGFCGVINRTHAPGLRRARTWIDSGSIGLIRHVDMEFFASGAHFAASVERPELVTDKALSGGGELMNFLGYCVDALRYLTGLEVESVTTFASSAFSPLHIAAKVEDHAVLSLGLAKGVTATITIGRIAQAASTTPTSSTMRILGSHGYATVDDEQPAPTVFCDGAARIAAADVGTCAARRYIEHVLASVTGRTQPDYGLDDALASLAVITAAYESWASGSEQPVPPTAPHSTPRPCADCH